ncbi:7-cyano-7-deazaguanine synthase [Roseovarius sp.]|uniref:7-cyano-7-deazaguanine synthase n=1 Tax=Roseovarius sp. TaxID=1486281 RepID=UPI003A96FBF1
MKTALLFSGGMDSACIAYWKRPNLAITIDYGQKPALGEIRAATEICRQLSIEHRIVRTDLSSLGSGDLAGLPPNQLAPESEWWPYRNQMLVTLAAMAAIKDQAKEIFIGCLKTDGFHADGTRNFVSKLDELMKLQEGGLRVSAPSIELTAAELVKKSDIPFDLLAWAHSCHKANEACGYCRGCRKHYETYQELGLEPY